jgi:hypothetical protein
MNTPYLPPVWERDTLGVSALKLTALLFMLAGIGAFISVWGN